MADIEIKTPLETGTKVETKVPEFEKKTRKARADKGKPRGKKDTIDGLDIKLALVTSLQSLSNSIAIASKNPAWQMNTKEAENINRAIDYWIKIRLPLLESKYKPEFVLALAFSGYFLRVATTKSLPKPLKEVKDEHK